MSGNCNQQTITEIVERIVTSGALGVGERQVALLRYLVNEELAGRGDQIKAYTIGTDVIGRGATFDPSQDAIVRVEVGRLRKTLELYFATQGRDCPKFIIIDKGTYRPRFAQSGALAPLHLPESSTASEASSRLSDTITARRSLRLVMTLAFLLTLALACVGLFQTFQSSDNPAHIETPLLLLQMPEIAGVAEQTEGMRFALQNALVQEIRSRNWLSVSLVDSQNHSAPKSINQPAFHLRTYLAAINDHYLVNVVLEREPNHEIIWTGRFEGEFDASDMGAFQRFLAEAVANDLVDLNGPMVESIAVRSEMTSPNADTPFRCMVNARRYLRFNGTKQFADTKACLSRLVDQDPSQSRLRALLVYLIAEEAIYPHLSPLPLFIDGREIKTPAERRAKLLGKAEELLDTSMPSERLLLAARLTLAACRGQADIPRSRLPALRALQTNNPDAYIAMGLIAGPFLEEWPLAISAEARAFSLKANPLPWYQFISAIKAAMDEDPSLALRMLSRLPMHNNAFGNTMVVAFGSEAGAALRVNNARATLERLGYRNTAALEALVDGSCYSEAVKKRIKRGLQSAMPPAPAR